MKSKSKILILFTVILSMVLIFSFKNIQTIFTDQSHFKLKYNSLFSEALSATSQYDDYIAIVASYTVNAINRDSSYCIQAFGKISENGIPIDAGQLVIGGATINADSNNLYSYTFPLSTGKALFGDSLDAEINPLSGPMKRLSGSKIIVVPKEIFPSTMALPESTVDRTTDYHLNWAPDPNNQFQKVQIQVS